MASKYDNANKRGERPVDIWGRPILLGAWVADSFWTKPRMVAMVDRFANGSANYAGFDYALNEDTVPSATTPREGAGAHVNWEVVGRPGHRPESYASVKRDAEGRPVLGLVNGAPREQPPCRVHGFDPAST